MSDAFSAAKIAILEALKADSAVAAIVGAKVFDEVPSDERGQPSDAQAPYIYCGPMGYARMEDGYNETFFFRLRLYCVSTKFGRDEVWNLHAAARRALDLKLIDTPRGDRLHEIKVMTGGDVISPLAPKQVFFDLASPLSSAESVPAIT